MKPTKVSLTTHTIRMFEERKSESLYLGAQHLPISFLDEFRVFVSELNKASSHNADERAVLSVLDYKDEDGVVWGTVSAGGYGMGRDIVSSESMKTVHRVAPNEAVMQPFYFMLSAQPDSRTAIFILQRHGSTGVLTTFTKMFKSWFTQRRPGLTFRVNRHVASEVFEYLKRGELKKIEYTVYRVPADVEERVRLGANMQEKVAVRTTVFAKRRGASLPMPAGLRRLIDRRSGRTNLMESVEDATDSLDTEEPMSFTFKFNGNERTINMANPSAIAPYIDITDRVQLGPDGHPKLADLHTAALGVRDDILEEMGAG